MAIQTTKQALSSKQKVFWAITVLLPIIIMMVPATETFTKDIKIFFALTVAGILMFAFELMDTIIPSIVLPFTYVLFQLAPMGQVFAPWTQSIVWMCMGAFLLAGILQRVGILKRIAYFCLIKTGGTYNGIVYGLVLVGFIIAIIKPGGAPAIIAALCFGICKAMGLGKSKAAAGIMIAGAVGSLTSGFAVYTPSSFGILISNANFITPVQVSFAEYMYHNAVFIPLLFVIAFAITKVLKPEMKIDGKEFFINEKKAMGKMSLEEKKCAVILACLVLFLFTTQIHKMDMAMGFIFLTAILYLPFMNVGTSEDIKQVNYGFLFFMVGCMSIGSVASQLGVGSLISQSVMPLLQGANSVAFIAIVWVLAFVVNFILTPLAAMATFGAPMTQIAIDLGVNPLPILYAFFQGLDQVIMPYEYALYLMFFSFGLIDMKDFIKTFTVKTVICFVYVLAIGVPYWMLIGLL